MIVYNTTFHFDQDILTEGLSCLKEIYIPKAISGGFLSRPCLRRIIGMPEDKGDSFAVQFHVKNIDTLNYWIEQDGNLLHRELSERFGHKMTGFSTLLEEIDLEV